MTSSPGPHLPAGDPTPSDGRQPILLLSHGCAGPRSRRAQRPNRPSSVWPVALHPSHPDARPIEPRLMEAIVPAVASYTRPGERVLSLALPSGPGMATPGPRAGTRGGLLPVLIEAARFVIRLGRTLEAHTAAPHVAARTAEGTSPTKGESAHRLPLESVRLTRADQRPFRRWRGLTAVRADCFDAVAVSVVPHYPDWGASVSWSVRRESCDLLALVTHGDRQRGRWSDPDGLATHTACGAGMTPLDRHGRITGPPASLAAHRDVLVSSTSTENLQEAAHSAPEPLSGSPTKPLMCCNPQQRLGWGTDNQVALQRGVA